ncbi:MAG: hypothetical protein LW806_04645 [Planctomycetaceae bacterium]|nr:hypothetical protein [Planctomycetaceae bacterium]
MIVHHGRRLQDIELLYGREQRVHILVELAPRSSSPSRDDSIERRQLETYRRLKGRLEFGASVENVEIARDNPQRRCRTLARPHETHEVAIDLAHRRTRRRDEQTIIRAELNTETLSEGGNEPLRGKRTDELTSLEIRIESRVAFDEHAAQTPASDLRDNLVEEAERRITDRQAMVGVPWGILDTRGELPGGRSKCFGATLEPRQRLSGYESRLKRKLG